MPDRQIARLLNRTGVETEHGNAWTQERVRGFRNHHDIAFFRDGDWAERGEITLEAAAQTHRRLQHDGAAYAPPRRVSKADKLAVGAPWVIKAEDLAALRQRQASEVSANTGYHAAGL